MHTPLIPIHPARSSSRRLPGGNRPCGTGRDYSPPSRGKGLPLSSAAFPSEPVLWTRRPARTALRKTRRAGGTETPIPRQRAVMKRLDSKTSAGACSNRSVTGHPVLFRHHAARRHPPAAPVRIPEGVLFQPVPVRRDSGDQPRGGVPPPGARRKGGRAPRLIDAGHFAPRADRASLSGPRRLHPHPAPCGLAITTVRVSAGLASLSGNPAEAERGVLAKERSRAIRSRNVPPQATEPFFSSSSKCSRRMGLA